MEEFKVKLRIRFRGNVRAHVEVFEHLKSPAWFASVRQRYQSAKNIKELQRIAKQVMQTEVLSKGSGKHRTGNLLESFQSATTDTGLAVFSDPSVATSKGPFKSGNPDDFSYAAFFEEPQFNSFLPPKDNPTDPRKHRPFHEPLERAVYEASVRQAMRAILGSIESKLPKQS